MKKWIALWVLCIPVFLITFMNSFFVASKVTALSQSECRPMFIFTPATVQHCSDIYSIDVFLIALKTEPLAYICLLTGMYLVAFVMFFLIKTAKNRKNIPF